jgi:tRNA(His) 5'-end guanylyltransferase
MQAMDAAAVALCEEVQGCQFAYVQSDEISLLVTDFGSMQELWFGGVVQKMCSISAAIASGAFRDGLPLQGLLTPRPQFDSRVFTVPTRDEAVNYFLWRQADCHRNAISMVAEAHFPSKRLLGKTVGDRHAMLAEKGVAYEDYPLGARHGRVVVKVAEEAPVIYRRKDTGEEKTEIVTRHRWEAQPAPWLDWDEAGFLDARIPHLEEANKENADAADV